MHDIRKFALPLLAFLVVLVSVPFACAQPERPVARSAASSTPQTQEEPEVSAATPSVDSAWSMLNAAAHRSTQTRIVTLAALGTMGSNAKAAELIGSSMNDPQLDVRTAAILAAGQTKNGSLIPNLRRKLNDTEPQVVFSAAATLWKMGDHSGESVLNAVAGGERRAKPGLVHGARNDVDRELHNPGALANLGASEGASLLLGPFGFGVTAFNYMRKSGSDPARAVAINLLAENKSAAVERELIEALADKDAAVRAAAAKALGERRDPAFMERLGHLFSDPKLPVRLTAAAAYINCSTASARHSRTRLQ